MYKTVYVLGPMRGKPYFNYPAFDAVAEQLRCQGHTVFNPADLDRLEGFDALELPEDTDWNKIPDTLSLTDIINRCVEAVRKSNAYWALPGWESSSGARAEKAILDWQGAEWLNDPAKMPRPLFADPKQIAEDLFKRAAQAYETDLNADRRVPGRGGAPTRATTLPEDAKARKTYPIASGFMDYFPDAVAAIAHLSWKGNEQHNPGEPLFWNRSKSGDEADTLLRHFVQRGTLDKDGIPHSVKVAWRAMALVQKEIEAEQERLNAERGRESFLKNLFTA